MKKLLAVFLSGAFLLLTVPVTELATAAPKGNGALAGHIFNEDMKTPVPNVIVKLRNVATQQEYSSDPTDPDGMYRIPRVEEGRYVMGVLGQTGSYNFQYSIMIKADALAKLSVAMKSGSAPVRLEEGISTSKKTSLLDFFKSPAGILTIITAVEVTLFAVALSEGESSPIID